MSAEVTLSPIIREESSSALEIIAKFNTKDWKYFHSKPISKVLSDEDKIRLQQNHEAAIKMVFHNQFSDDEITQLTEIYQSELYDRFDTLRITVLNAWPGSELEFLYEIETIRKIAMNALNLTDQRVAAWCFKTQETELHTFFTVKKIRELTDCILNSPRLYEALCTLFETLIFEEFNDNEIDQLWQIRSSPISHKLVDCIDKAALLSRIHVTEALRPFHTKLIAYAIRGLSAELEKEALLKQVFVRLKELLLNNYDKCFDLPEPTPEELQTVKILELELTHYTIHDKQET